MKTHEKTTDIENLKDRSQSDAARLVDEFWLLLYSDDPADLDTKMKLVDTAKKLRYLMKKNPKKIRDKSKKKSK